MSRGLSLIRSFTSLNLRQRNFSALPSEVVIHLDKETIVCWHPEQPFPYEFSKPVPKKKEESILTVGRREIDEMYKTARIETITEELAKLTQTSKHRWFPRSRDRRAKKTKPDRKYL